MKKILLSIMVVLICQNINAKDNESCVFNYDYSIMALNPQATVGNDYKNTAAWKRHNTQKAWGWAALGVGTVGMGVAYIGGVGSLVTFDSDKASGYGALFLVSACSVVASIPLFLCANHNKKKAMNSSLALGNSYTISPDGKKISQPALCLQVNF